MTQQNHRKCGSASVPATSSTQFEGKSFDAHGFDPDDFEWVPLPRQPRSDGWSPELQRAFIEALADTGSVTQAAKAVNMTTMSCYRLRRQRGGESFATAWTAALAVSAHTLIDIAFDRAVNGVEEPVFDRDGHCIHMRTRINDRLLMFLLKSHHPETYGANGSPPKDHGSDHRAGRGRDDGRAMLDAALTMLDPVAPADPLQLLSPERFAELLPLPQPDDLQPALTTRQSASLV